MSETDAEASDETTEEDAPRKKSGLLPIIGLALFFLLGGGGFFATYSGMLSLDAVLGGGDDAEAEKAGKKEKDDAKPSGPAFAYVPIGEMVIPLGPRAEADVLILESEIEVSPEDVEGLKALTPRIRDVFNTYLRAIEETDIVSPDAGIRLRAQLLRRIRVVADPIEPRDLLFTSFILR